MVTAPAVRRVMVGTDRSESADRAVRWAASFAAPYGAELVLLQVLPVTAAGDDDGPGQTSLEGTREQLGRFANEVAGARGFARVVGATTRGRVESSAALAPAAHGRSRGLLAAGLAAGAIPRRP